MWAADETITFANLGLENGVQYTDPFGTNISVTFGGGANDGKYYDTGSGIRTYGDGTITITAKGNTITAIITTFSGSSNAPASDEIWTSNGTGTGTSGTSASWEGSATEVVMKRPSGSGHWRLQAITVTYTTGGSSLKDSDLALTDAPVALEFDLYNNTGAQFVEYTTSSTGAVTVSASDYVTTAVDQENKKIAVIPKTSVTPSAQTITVSQEADENYKAGSVTFTVAITDSTPIPTHKAVFSVNGAITEQEFEEGAAIEFPATPDNISGKAFVGWTHFPISGTTNEPPTIYTSATMGDSDVFFYAVYAYASGESSNKSVTINSGTSGVPTSYGTANTFTEYTLGGEKFQIQQMYLNSGKLQWRAAGNTNGTGTMYNSESLGKITSIVLTYNSSDSNKNFTLKVGNSANPTGGTEVTPTIDGSTYTFDCSSLNYGFFVLTNGSGAGYLDGIVINYTIGSTTYSDYCTTVAKVATFSYEDYPGEGTKDSGSSYTMIQTDVRISHNKFYCSDTYPSAYFYGYGDVGEGIITVTPTGGATITRIEITTTDTDHNGWQIIGSEKPGEIIPSVGEITANNEDKTKATMTTWTGSSSEQFTITNTRTIVWSSIKVYYTGGLPKCATPAISGETSFITYSTVSISCATEGATIQYSTSTDGVNYTAYQPYTGPFQVSQTTTVKAQATKEGMVPSDEAYKGFVQHDVIPNIGYFISSHATTPFTDPEYLQLEDALVTYKNENTAYIQDAYRAIMLYNCAGDLEAGDKVHGYMKVTGYNPSYNGLPEITAFELVDGYVKTKEPEVNPTVVTLDELMGDPASNPYEMYLSKYVKIENATVTSAFSSQNCTIEQGGKSIILRDQTGTLTSTVGDNVTVTGHVAIFNTTKQISVYEQSQIVVSAAPAVPTITVTPSSLTGFTYVEGNGPSAAQTITVSGTNLTSDITLDTTTDKYEMSLNEASGYTNNLTLTPSAGEVAETTIYVRLKADMPVNASYNGDIVITSTDATTKYVNLSGSVTKPEASNVTWDLSKATYDEVTDPDIVTWSSAIVTMTNSSKSGGTSASNYLGGDSNNRTSSRFYSGNTLTITPASAYTITSVVFTATSDGYATALANSTWTNATASASKSVVTVTPKDGTAAISAAIGGTCGFTFVKVYYKTSAPSTDPSMEVNPASVDALAAGDNGTLAITYANLTINDMIDFGVQFYDADNNELNGSDEPKWLEVLVAEDGSDYVVSYVVDANDGAARTAYCKIFAMGKKDFVYSNLITITQAAYVEGATYTLASSITPGKHYIIVGYNEKDGSYKAMGVQKSNNRAAVDVTENAGTIAVTTDVCEFVIYGPNANRFYTLYDVAEGYLYAASSKDNYLRSQTTNDINGKWVISIDPGSKIASIFADGSSNRNVMQYNSSNTLFSCYASASQSPVYLYEKEGDTPVATTTSVTLNKYGYATFASTSTLDFLDADKATYGAFELTGVSDSKITFNQITETVAAGTGILLKGNANETITLNILPAGGATLSSNLLEGVTEPKTIADNEYYGLSGDKFVKVGAGTVPAGKALLPASVVGSSIKAFNFVFEDDPDGINSIDNGELTIDNAAIYNLAGQRLSKMQKGINIVNGKKILK